MEHEQHDELTGGVMQRRQLTETIKEDVYEALDRLIMGRPGWTPGPPTNDDMII